MCPECLVGKADFEMIELSEAVEVITEQTLNEETQQEIVRKIIIIGSGYAGYQLAKSIRALNSDVAIVIFTADDGAYYSKPALSNAFKLGKSGEQLISSKALQIEQELNIRIYSFTNVSAIHPDKKQIITDIGDTDYDALVLATGTTPVRLPIAGNGADEAMISVNNHFDYVKFRQRIADKKEVVILGDGLIGCEFANDLADAGFNVSVVGLSETPMAKLVPQAVGKVLQEQLQKSGVHWYLQNTITEIEKQENGFSVHLQNGQILKADIVLSAVGLRANTQLASEAGLLVNQGIKVNQYGQTSDAAIYAIGDCVETEDGMQPYLAPINQMIPAVSHSILGHLSEIEWSAVPIIVKTPVAPLTISPVKNCEDAWVIEQVGDDQIKAVIYDRQRNVMGFVLLGADIQHQHHDLMKK